MSCTKIMPGGLLKYSAAKGGGHGGSGIRGTQSFPPQIIPSASELSGNSSGQRHSAVVKTGLSAWPEIASLQPHVWRGLGSGD